MKRNLAVNTQTLRFDSARNVPTTGVSSIDNQFNLYDPTPRILQEPSSPKQSRRVVMSNNFTKNYKDFSFDMMKQRHDNFSFGRAVQMNQRQNDTLHFANPSERTTRPPDLLLLQRRELNGLRAMQTVSADVGDGKNLTMRTGFNETMRVS
jgi:hypothetical protein